MRSILIGLGVTAVFGAQSARAAPLVAWTELVGTTQSIRAVSTAQCPSLLADGRVLAMTTRASDDAEFPNACQAEIPRSTRQVSIDGSAVPILKAAIHRIVIIGDTGCRIKKKTIQDCADPKQWPFAQVAANAAAEKPDLVIHVGDYLYRETPCPPALAGCHGQPSGDNWAAWSADFFAPAAPLLHAAPWIFVRGNHEQCGRAAIGWFRLLDAGHAPVNCPASSAPFVVPLGKLSLNVVDSADTVDDAAPADKVALFQNELHSLQPGLSAHEGWILTHRPIWGFAPGTGDEAGEIGEGIERPTNLTEQQAVKGENVDAIRLVLSGHVHLFAAANYAGKRPPQLIVGNSGTLRDGDVPGIQTGKSTIAGLTASSFVVEQFGYLVVDLNPTGWTGTLKRFDGTRLARCSLDTRELRCMGD